MNVLEIQVRKPYWLVPPAIRNHACPCNTTTYVFASHSNTAFESGMCNLENIFISIQQLGIAELIFLSKTEAK